MPSNTAGALEEPGSTSTGSLNNRHMRRVLFSSFLGSAIEFYDLMLYAFAASVVFSQVFFTQLNPALALFVSYGTMAAGYLARPLGGLIFGPIGDRKGRKTVLITTLLLMGVSSALIGLLPGQAVIGVAAPILLVLLRIMQGVAVGGEWGGSMLIALEHAPKAKRGFAASFASLGGPAGTVTATGALGLVAMLPDDAFYTWGWRIPFLISFGLVAIGLFVRLKIAETPVFQQMMNTGRTKTTPVRDVFTKQWRAVALAATAGLAPYVLLGVFVIWSTAFVVDHGMGRSVALNLHIIGSASLVLSAALAARLSDRFGRRPVMLTGIASGILLSLPLMLLLQAGTAWTVLLAIVGAQALSQGLVFGPLGSFTAELFPTHMRYTGASVSYQTAATLGAGLTPMIATLLYNATGQTSTVPIVVFLAVTVAASGVAIWRTREGSQQDLTSTT